jgi:hypothetical protein
MTTSMDGIEEIANESKENNEQAIENGLAKAEEENTEQDAAEIPVNILGGDEKPQNEQKVEDSAAEESAPVAEEQQQNNEAPQEESEPPKEESIPEKEPFELQVKYF